MKIGIMGILLFVIISVQFAMSPGAEAQTNNPCISYLQCQQNSNWYPICWGNISGGFNCQGQPWLYETICLVMNSQCYLGPIETHCNCGGSSPISFADGNTWIIETDIKLPGLSSGLQLTRRWNSIWPASQMTFQVGLFGPNWRSNFEERIFLGSDNYLKYARGDGSFWSFGYNGGVWTVVAPANTVATLVPGATSWTLTFGNGEQRVFDGTSGNLISIIDRNGNSTQLSYNATGYLAMVTDPVSRTLSFTYGNQSFPGLVTSVTSSAGITISYAYDSQGRLTQVTEADSSTLNFQYNTQSDITAVTDSQGVVLESHTYDSNNRGLTGSRANGVESVSVSYPN